MAQQLGVSSGSPTDTTSPVANRPPPSNTFSKALIPIRDESLDAEEQDAFGEDGERGTAGNRWPRQETLALLKIRSDMDAAFRDSSLKGPLWEEVSRNLAEMGHHRSAKKCKEKFENVHKYYKRTKDGKAGRQDGKSYRFFSQLEALYGKSGVGGNVSHKNATGLLAAGVAGIGGSFGLGTSTIPKTRGPFVSNSEPVGAFGTGDRTVSGIRPESDFSSGLNFSSDSSDDDFEEPADSENLDCKKRKRKSTKKYLLLFENIMKKVLDKQEQLQQKFLEALERRDQDRMIREEAWKRQEMARLNREHDLRAQERALSSSRDAALVAFLQKVTGQTLQLPQMAMQVQSQALVPVDTHDDLLRDKEFYDPSSKRWPKPEVLSLIRLRTGLDQKFHEPGSKGLLWEDISAGMSREGYSRTAKRCKEKWENINKYFKKAKESNKKRPENAKTCPYFHHLDVLYKEGVLGNSHSKQLLLEKAEEQSENVLDQPNVSNTREDSGQAQEGDSEILAIMPSGENESAGLTTCGNDVAMHFFVSPENGSASGATKVKPKENQLTDSGSVTPPATTAPSPLNLERVNSAKFFPGPSKPTHSDQVQIEKEVQFSM